jgi:hypothetical protein
VVLDGIRHSVSCWRARSASISPARLGVGSVEDGGHAGTSGIGMGAQARGGRSRRSPVVASTSGASHGARGEAYFFSAG